MTFTDRLFQLAASALLAALLAGCAAPGAQKIPDSECVASASALPLQSYAPGSLQVANVTHTSACLIVPSGTSRTVAYRLPEPLRGRAVLEAVTEYEGAWLPAASIYVPLFLFYDEAFRPLDACEPPLYQRTGKLYASAPIARAFYGACMVPAGTRYLVLRTDASAPGAKPVRFLSPGGAAASARLEQAEREYRAIDKRAFATGAVPRLPDSDAFMKVEIPRKAVGEVRFMLSRD